MVLESKNKMTWEEFVSGSVSILKRVDKQNIVLFLDVGAFSIKKIFDLIGLQNTHYIYKLTAISKISISKQIMQFLTEDERKKTINKNISSKILKKLKDKNLYSKYIKKIKGKGAPNTLEEWISVLINLELYVPIEDEDFLIKKNIFNSSITFAGEDDDQLKRFNIYRENIVDLTIRHFNSIRHPTRDLLNKLLRNTEFAKSIRNKEVYVVDEAISRSRTLNTLEIILKSFNNKVKWKIGVLFSSYAGKNHRILDYIHSNLKTPPFSNRPDLAGYVVGEGNRGLERIYLESKQSIDKNKKIILSKYNEKIINFIKSIKIENKLPNNDLIKTMILIFISGFKKPVKIMEFNILKGDDLIEQISFYLCQPDPYLDINKRNKYKRKINDFISELERKLNAPNINNRFRELKNEYKRFRSVFRDFELQKWSELRNEFNAKIINTYNLLL